MDASREGIVVGLIGKDGRTSAIECALRLDRRVADVVMLAEGKEKTREEFLARVSAAVERYKPAFVIIGPEEPLAHGVVEYLRTKYGIPSVGPSSRLARLETSKSFTRQLVARHRIPGNPRHRIFSSMVGIEEFLRQLGDFVVKPDGLTGGKGVMVSGDHLDSVDDALAYCEELLRVPGAVIVIEEKLEGEEFSLQSFCDGRHVAHMPIVQDHKRANEGDTGPNTGGMGSYSSADHSLPFVTAAELAAAQNITERIARALFEDTGEEYKGILFGGFMATKYGVRLLEYNARFGDPEALNVLSLLETSFLDICERIIDGTLDPDSVTFRHSATVCKYLVPDGYPSNPESGSVIDLSSVPSESEHLRIYRAAVRPAADGDDNHAILTGSRAIAFVGIASTLDEAEAIAEEAVSAVRGKVRHRRDIGTKALVQRRVDHMQHLHCDHRLTAVGR